jgi:predicted aconitase
VEKSLQLTEMDQAKLDGAYGAGVEMAMRIIVRMARILDAEKLIDIEGAHIDSSLYMGDATLEFAERLVELGAKVSVPSTLNVSGVDEHGWQSWPVDPLWAEKARRQMVAYERMGCNPIWTCAPYQSEFKPVFGQQIAWGESNAIVYANSVIGARTERYPDLLDICAAITGRVPAFGLHLTENRIGQLHLRLKDVPVELQAEDSFYPVLGHHIGKIAGESLPVIDGLKHVPKEDQLKALGAAMASSGTVGMFHLVGITPEATTLAHALGGGDAPTTIDITREDLTQAWKELSTADGEDLDMVVLGSPHFSIAEFKQLVPLLMGKKCHPDVRFLITSSRAMRALAEGSGALDVIDEFGGTITVDTCILTTPMLPPEIKVLMTNSAKYAYYAPGMLNTQVVFGSLEDCVASAVEGRVGRDVSLWSN